MVLQAYTIKAAVGEDEAVQDVRARGGRAQQARRAGAAHPAFGAPILPLSPDSRRRYFSLAL